MKKQKLREEEKAFVRIVEGIRVGRIVIIDNYWYKNILWKRKILF